MSEQKKKILSADVKSIGNAYKRNEVYLKQKTAKAAVKDKERKKRAREAEILGDAAPPKKIPKTIDMMREEDITTVAAGDEEIKGEEAMDEFASYYHEGKKPKLCLTSCLRPTKRMYKLLKEFLYVFPNSYYYPRRGFAVKEIVKQATDEGFTDLIIVNEDHKEINGITVIHLPEGPTAYFKLTNVVLNSEIKDHGTINQIARPEVILNRFSTRIGQRVSRLLGALFHQEPFFRSRRVITFHNQRDFIFFRHHRYVFDRVGDAKEEEEKMKEKLKKRALEKRKGRKSQSIRDATRDAPKLLEGEAVINNSKVKARIQEIGPQFTMKLKWMQHGTFDKEHGEYEWKQNADMGHSRRKFAL